MVLLLSDAGSVNKPEDRENFHRLSSASSTTLAASPAHRASRVSRRAVLVLLFHGSLILITTALLVVSIFRWEHRLSVDGGKSSNLSSYIYLGTQTFFTGVVLLLYETSRSIAVDAAIRHPHNLIELNNRIAAWSGLPAAVFNWFSKSPSSEHGSRLRRPYRSTYIGIPLYLIAGFVLQLSASGIFGINLYDHPTTSSNIQYAAVSHSGNYGMNYAADTATSWRDSRFLWEAARAEVFLAKVNHTDWPGLQGPILHDIPIAGMMGYEVAHVNATRLNVQCGQPRTADVGIEVLLLPTGTTDPTTISSDNIVHANSFDSDGDTASIMPNYEQDVWLNVSIPRPLYWPEDEPGPNITAKWAASGLSDTMPTRFFLQPWIFDGQGTVGHQQMILVLATGDVDHLIRDSDNSTGWYTKFEFNTALAHSNAPAPSAGVSSATAPVPTAGIGAESVESRGNVGRSRLVEGYVQVIGCTLCIEEMQVAITERGFLADESTPTHPAPHPWEDFEWQESSEESIERQFLITWTPTGQTDKELVSGAPMERLLRQQMFVNDTDGDNTVDGAMHLPVTLDMFEDRLERLTSTYLYSYWRKCQGPLMMFAFDCANFHDHREAESVKQYAAWATFTGYGKEARLEIQGYRAVIAFVASLVMGVLACCLLRVRTEAKVGEEVMDWNVLDGVRLMRGSALPMIVGDEGPEGVRIRYRPAGDGIYANLDHHEEYEKVP